MKMLHVKILRAAVFSLAAATATAFLTAAQPPAEHTSRIESQRSEKWWGVFVGNSPVQPFEKPFDVDTDLVSADGLRVAMLVSNAGRYVWSPRPMTVGFDGTDFSIFSDHEKVAVQKGGKNLREAYLVCAHKHFTPDGALPPLDLLTMPVYNTRIEFGYTGMQYDVLRYADKIIAEGLPAGIILLSDEWQSYTGTYDFDRERFPDPAAMVEQLHTKGFKVMLTLTPVTGAFGRPYVWGKGKEYLLKGADGRPMIVETDGGYGVGLDFTRQPLADYCRERIEMLQLAYGIDGFRFDCRALLSVLADMPERAEWFANWYGLGQNVENSIYVPGKPEPLTASVREILPGGHTGWMGLRAALCNVLTAGLVGFPYAYVSPNTTADRQELFENDALMGRLLQLCAWFPVAEIPFAPWRIGDPVLRAEAQNAIRMRAQFADYIAQLARESARTGEPLLRHMEYQFPRNGFSDCNNQFMLGNKYLFAPVVDNEPVRTVRLPRGVWTDADGRRFKGPVVTNVNTANGKTIWFELSGK